MLGLQCQLETFYSSNAWALMHPFWEALIALFWTLAYLSKECWKLVANQHEWA